MIIENAFGHSSSKSGAKHRAGQKLTWRPADLCSFLHYRQRKVIPCLRNQRRNYHVNKLTYGRQLIMLAILFEAMNNRPKGHELFPNPGAPTPSDANAIAIPTKRNMLPEKCPAERNLRTKVEMQMA